MLVRFYGFARCLCNILRFPRRPSSVSPTGRASFPRGKLLYRVGRESVYSDIVLFGRFPERHAGHSLRFRWKVDSFIRTGYHCNAAGDIVAAPTSGAKMLRDKKYEWIGGGFMTERHSRKVNRLRDFDYSAPGAYFVTCCTKDKRKCFWKTGTYSDGLSPAGELLRQCILEIPVHYPYVQVGAYAVMPNHVHLLLVCDRMSPLWALRGGQNRLLRAKENRLLLRLYH